MVIVVIKHLKESRLQIKGFGGKEKQDEEAKVIAVVKHLKESQLQKGFGGKEKRRRSQGNCRCYTFEGGPAPDGVRRRGD